MPVHDRHADVHKDHVGAQLGGEVDGLLPVTGFTDDLDVVGDFQDLAEPDAYQRLVVRDEHTDHRGTGRVTWMAKPPSERGPACKAPP